MVHFLNYTRVRVDGGATGNRSTNSNEIQPVMDLEKGLDFLKELTRLGENPKP